MSKKQKKVLKLPESGHPLIDLIFRCFVSILESENVKIYKLKGLKLPDTGKKKDEGDDSAYGLCWFDGEYKIHIFLDPTAEPKIPTIKILIHELSHALFNKSTVKHDTIFYLQELLYLIFTEDQKKFLLGYAPKHFTKKKPPLMD